MLVALVVAAMAVVSAVSVAASLYAVDHGKGSTSAVSAPTATVNRTGQILSRSAKASHRATDPAAGANRSVQSAHSRRIFHVTPDGTGERDGSGWDAAGTLGDVAAFVERAEPGDEVWIRGDQGDYEATETIELTSGGDAGAPITIRGVAGEGSGSATPRLVGERSDPYRIDGDAGRELFKLLDGADHLRFRNMAFANQGNGVFRVGADIRDLAITDVRANNVRRFIEDYPSGSEDTATITGLVVEDVEVHGFSKGAIRLRDDTHDVVIRDMVGDSQQQDGDEFAIGVHLGDRVHDVLFERVVMRNSLDTGSESDYWNGDGFATERNTHHITFRDTRATGNSDAGYDLKGTATTLVRALAAGNKRNFRFWGTARASDCVARDPVKLGGTGSRANVWAADGAQVRLVGCSFGGGDRLLSIEDGAHVAMVADFEVSTSGSAGRH
jgi:hypothetical protein